MELAVTQFDAPYLVYRYEAMSDSFEIEPAVVTGPATDNAVGIDQIRERLSLDAINALSNGVALGDHVAAVLKEREAA